jgi:hypothetical protein
MYRVFTRNWWKEATTAGWPDGLEPDTNASQHTIDNVHTEEEARAIAQHYNKTHDAGRLSKKAEFTYE